MIATRPFGRTGHQSTRLLFGAAGIGWIDPRRLDGVFEVLAASGINHIDTAAGYGESEVRLRAVPRRPPRRLLPRHQDRRARRRRGARRARTIARPPRRRPRRPHPAAQPRRARRVGGRPSAPAARSRRSPGPATRVSCASSASPATGCASPAMHLRSLERFDFDSVLLPYNHAVLPITTTAGDVEALLATCAERERRGADDQVGRPATLGRRRGAARVLVRAAPRGRRPRPSRRLRAGRTSSCSSTPAATCPCSRRWSPPPSIRARRPPTTSSPADAEAFGVTPLFDGGELERI